MTEWILTRPRWLGLPLAALVDFIRDVLYWTGAGVFAALIFQLAEPSIPTEAAHGFVLMFGLMSLPCTLWRWVDAWIEWRRQ